MAINDPDICIAEAEQFIDGQAARGNADKFLKKTQNLKCVELVIDPLKAGWNTPILDHHFRSGNAPIMAIESAVDLLRNQSVDVVVITGEDNLRSDYSSEERHKMMDIYHGISVPEAYTQLAKKWCELRGLSEQTFILLAEALFENYYKASLKKQIDKAIDQKWFQFITDLFRGVDCANPVVDYFGKLVLTRRDIFEKYYPGTDPILIKGVATAKTKESDLSALNEVAKYEHLKVAYEKALQQSGVDFLTLYKNGKALLEVYTCFPIVPLAFLFSTGFFRSVEEAKKIIQHYPVTITGGMNLAKAPWNNPALRATIEMYFELLDNDNVSIGAIHGNGGLGEKQGFLILGK